MRTASHAAVSEPLTARDAALPLEPFAVNDGGVANLLTISRRHVANLDATGRLPRAIHLGRCKRWVTAELREWLAAGAPPRDRWEEMTGRKSGGGKPGEVGRARPPPSGSESQHPHKPSKRPPDRLTVSRQQKLDTEGLDG